MNKEEFRAWREKKKMTQDELGLLIGISSDTVYRIEAGIRRILAKHIIRIGQLKKVFENKNITVAMLVKEAKIARKKQELADLERS